MHINLKSIYNIQKNLKNWPPVKSLTQCFPNKIDIYSFFFLIYFKAHFCTLTTCTMMYKPNSTLACKVPLTAYSLVLLRATDRLSASLSRVGLSVIVSSCWSVCSSEVDCSLFLVRYWLQEQKVW